MYDVGEPVEVVCDPMSVQYLGTAPTWVATIVEPQPAKLRDLGFSADGMVYVRVGGMLVTRSFEYVRKVELS